MERVAQLAEIDMLLVSIHVAVISLSVALIERILSVDFSLVLNLSGWTSRLFRLDVLVLFGHEVETFLFVPFLDLRFSGGNYFSLEALLAADSGSQRISVPVVLLQFVSTETAILVDEIHSRPHF